MPRPASPKRVAVCTPSIDGGTMKAQGLYQAVRVWICVGGTHVGFAATGPALFGSPTTSGRGAPEPVFVGSKDSSGVNAWPEEAPRIPFTCQPPTSQRDAPSPETKCLPGPNGSSY